MREMTAADIKRNYDQAQLRALAEAEGLKTQQGRMQCPARCSEDPRGATVSTKDGTGVFHCHRCGASGSAIDLIALARAISVADALRVLSERGAPPPVPQKPKPPPIDGAAVWERLASSDAEGIAYLEGRGLGEAVERELVRFSTGATGDFWVDAKAREGYRVAVPLRDKTGAVRSFQTRCTRVPADPKKTKLNLPGSITGLAFGEPSAARVDQVVYLAEGLADSLAIQLAGVTMVGAPGEGMVKHLVPLLGVVAGRTIVLCPQNDATHHRSEIAFAAVGRELKAAGAIVRTLRTPPEYKDPADWLKAVGLKAFTASVRAAPASSETPSLNVVPFPAPDSRAPKPGAPQFYPLTDAGNAERLVARHGRDLRFCHTWKSWLIWNGQHWAEDTSAEIMRRAKDTARAMSLEAAEVENNDIRDALVKHSRKSESAGALRNMVALAQSEPGIPIQPSDLDRDPWLFNCANGTVDLRTGELRPHAREDLLTKMSPVAFDPAAECPRWLAFLDRIMGGDQELVAFLQRAAGYALTGKTGEHCLFILYGTGRNGKGTFRDTLRAALGGYAHEADFSTFVANKNESPGAPREDLVALMGARFVAASEMNAGRRLDEALIKRLTGEDPIRARRLNENGFTFIPVAKYFLAVNDKPVVRGMDEGIWSRLRLVPFTVQIPESERDPELREKLLEELPGILSWAVRGCLEWQRIGLAPPAAVVDATKEYREEMDVFADFLASECVEHPEAKAKAGELYSTYKRWCDENGVYPQTQNAFGRELTKKGFKSDRNFSLGRFWVGIGLIDRSGRQEPMTQEASWAPKPSWRKPPEQQRFLDP